MPRKGWTSYSYILGAVLALHTMALWWSWQSSELTPQASSQSPAVVRLKLHHSTKKQIVQSEDPREHQTPVEDSFLSDKDRTFDRQTVAKKIDQFKNASLGNAELSLEEKSSQEKKDFKNLKLSDVGPTHDYAKLFVPDETQSARLKAGRENGEAHELGLSASNDYIDEMTLGDFTQLNTTEFKHYGFYHRIRQKLEQFWGRSIQEKAQALYKSGRHIASQNHITALVVTLNEKGEILAAEIKTSSGIRELDQAAVESFNEAGPFPNPPKDLLKDGRAVIEWGFVVKT